MKKKNLNRIFASLGIFTMSFTTLSVGMAPLNTEAAGNGTGGGNAGSGGAGTWHTDRGKDGTSQAWNAFIENAQRVPYNGGWAGKGWVEREVVAAGNRHGNPNLLKQCKESRYIHWYGNTPYKSVGGWSSQGSYTQNASWDSKPPADEWNLFMQWGGNNWRKGNTVLICSGSFDVEPPACADKKTTKKRTKNDGDIDGVYAMGTKMSPNVREEFNTYDKKKLAAWNSTHENQSSPMEKTEYGKWFDKNEKRINALNSKSGAAYEKELADLKKGAADAKKKDAGKVPPTLKMSNKNQKGFSAGGVYTVTDNKQNNKTGLSRQFEDTTVSKCTMVRDKNGKWQPTYGAPKTTSKELKGDKVKQQNTTLPTNFWQMLHARCNEPGLQATVTTLNNEKKNQIQYMDNNAGLTNTLTTMTYDKQKDLPLSNPKYGKKPVNDTAYDPYYNETSGCLVPIDCVSAPSTAPTGSKAEENVQDTKLNINNKFGSQGLAIVNNGEESVVSSDSFEFFRDNNDNEIRLDQWYPILNQDKKGLDLKQTKASFTNLMFDPLGTPKDEMVAVTPVAAGNNEVTGKMIADSTGLQYPEEVTNLKVRGSWASDSDAPHRVNAEWIYEPELESTINTEIGGDGYHKDDEKVTIKNKIRVGCSLNMNNKGVVKPKLDLDPSGPPAPIDGFNDSPNAYTSFKFVRAGSSINK